MLQLLCLCNIYLILANYGVISYNFSVSYIIKCI